MILTSGASELPLIQSIDIGVHVLRLLSLFNDISPRTVTLRNRMTKQYNFIVQVWVIAKHIINLTVFSPKQIVKAENKIDERTVKIS